MSKRREQNTTSPVGPTLCLGWDVGGWMGKKDGLASGVLLEDGGFLWVGATHRCGLGPDIATGDLCLPQLLELVKDGKPAKLWNRIVVGVDAPLGFPAAFVAAAAASIEQLGPLKQSGVFVPMVVQMINVGEQTGGLDEMLSKIADFFDDEVDAAVAALTSILKPVMIVAMGVVIGGIVVAMYLPMFDLAQTVQG